ncbi:MAG: hypothetical protein NUW37_19515 [Planctomycetes bacterium]|nr:hypothetical protein [Planctomycetota bacterium]
MKKVLVLGSKVKLPESAEYEFRSFSLAEINNTGVKAFVEFEEWCDVIIDDEDRTVNTYYAHLVARSRKPSMLRLTQTTIQLRSFEVLLPCYDYVVVDSSAALVYREHHPKVLWRPVGIDPAPVAKSKLGGREKGAVGLYNVVNGKPAAGAFVVSRLDELVEVLIRENIPFRPFTLQGMSVEQFFATCDTAIVPSMNEILEPDVLRGLCAGCKIVTDGNFDSKTALACAPLAWLAGAAQNDKGVTMSGAETIVQTARAALSSRVTDPEVAAARKFVTDHFDEAKKYVELAKYFDLTDSRRRLFERYAIPYLPAHPEATRLVAAIGELETNLKAASEDYLDEASAIASALPGLDRASLTRMLESVRKSCDIMLGLL